jgi:hypothetical protein
MAALRFLSQTPRQRSQAAARASRIRWIKWVDVRATVRAAALPKAKPPTRRDREKRLRLDVRAAAVARAECGGAKNG